MPVYKITRTQAVWIEYVGFVAAESIGEAKQKVEAGEVTNWQTAPDCSFDPVNEKESPVDFIIEVD